MPVGLCLQALRKTVPARIYLAPMEGLLDFVLRDILTRVGGVDHCVSEFIRVTHTLLTECTFLRVMPGFGVVERFRFDDGYEAENIAIGLSRPPAGPARSSDPVGGEKWRIHPGRLNPARAVVNPSSLSLC